MVINYQLNQNGSYDNTLLYGLILIFTLVVLITQPLMAYQVGKERYEKGLGPINIQKKEPIEEKTNIIESATSKNKRSQYDDKYLIYLQIHTNIVFYVSVIFVILGLMILILALINFETSKNPNLTLDIISGLCAVILKFAGGTAMLMYFRLMQEQRSHVERIAKVQGEKMQEEIKLRNHDIAIEYAKEIKDDVKREEIVKNIITNLIGN